MSSTIQDKSYRSTQILQPTAAQPFARFARRVLRPARWRRLLVRLLALLMFLQPSVNACAAVNAQIPARAQQSSAAGAKALTAAGIGATTTIAPFFAAIGGVAQGHASRAGVALAAGLAGIWEALAQTGEKLFGAEAQQATATTTIFGPRKFVRAKGSPFTEVERFKAPADVSAPFTLFVQNGDASGSNRVSSGTIKLNGVEIFSQSDFNHNVGTLQSVVTLKQDNTLEVKLASQPGSYIFVSVLGVFKDTTAPAVAIISPANGLTTTESSVVVSGTASDPGANASGIAGVYVNNSQAVYNPATGTWSIANVALAVGSNQLTARAVDKSGNESIASITVTRQEAPRDTTPPVLAVTSPADNSATAAESITVSGTVSDPEPSASGVAQVTVNNTQAARDVMAGTWTLAALALNVGPNVITVRATDKAGNVSTRQITVTRNQQTPTDSQPPLVQITSPQDRAVVFAASVTVTGTAVDEGPAATGVKRIFVNGEEAIYNAGNHTWAASNVALAEGDNLISVEAEDAANPPNKGHAEIHVTRRTVAAPRLTVNNPQVGAVLSAGTVTVAGEVTSGAADIPVAVKVNGEAAQVAGGQYTKTVSLADGSNTITVVATDALNQIAQSSVTVISDQRPPTVTLAQPPALVQPGSGFVLHAEAADNVGLEAVDFLVDGQLIATVLKAPYEFAFEVPAAAAPDRIIEVTAVARDLTGATAVDSAQTRVAGPSGVSGYVFDDATGYVLQGVTATATGGAAVLTPESGVYSFVSSSPRGVVRLSKEGYTPVERGYESASGGGTALFDARLTRLDQHSNPLSAAGGQAVGDGGRVQLDFDPGALAVAADVRGTSVSPQGLANLLPYGWSPVPGAVVDVRAAGAEELRLLAPAHLTISQVQGLASDTALVLARYDELAHVWSVVSVSVTAGEGGRLTAELPLAGQYAFLVADTGATAPPAAQVGQALTSAAPAQPSALDSATATAVATPRSAVMSKEARSTISFIARSQSKLPSGVSVEVTFEETYNLLRDSEQVQVERPTQDFMLYAYPAATASEPHRLGAFFVAKPTRTDITVAQLRAGNVHVAIRPGRASTTGVLVGAGGGQVTTDDGAELRIAAGGLSSNTPVFLNSVPDTQVGFALPNGYEIVGTLDVDLSGATLSSAGTISTPLPAGDLSRVLVARLVPAGGQRVAKIVARAVPRDGKLVSTTEAPAVPSGVVLQGIRAGGRYVFVRVPNAFGYVTGAVTEGEGGAAATSVRVSVDRTPFADVTGADGRFVVVGVAGAAGAGRNEVIAASTLTDATGAAPAVLSTQDATAEVGVPVNSAPLTVAAVSPADGASDVVATTPVTVTFSKPVMPATVTNSSFRLVTEAGNPVLGSVTVLAGSRVASFTPAAALSGSARYRVLLGTGILDLYGRPLSAPFESSFGTAAVVKVDDRLKPERIRVGYPDGDGLATVFVPAFSVPLGSVILALNNTSGGTATTVADASGVTLKIYARVGDEIVLIVRQPDGAEYSVAQAAYRRPDGVTSVTENGGAVATDDGALVLSVPKGAIKGQAEITLTPKTEADITAPRIGDLASVPVKGGVEIKAEGDFKCEKELHLALPAPADMPEGQRVAFMSPRKVASGGQLVEVWEPVTSGRVEDGKFKTNSPPFTGLVLLDQLAWIYVFAPVNKRVIFGRVYENESGAGIKNALVLYMHQNIEPNVTILAGATVGRTSDNGGFALFDFTPDFQEGLYVAAIDDTNNRRGATFAVPLTAQGADGYVEGKFMQGLTGFLAARGDIGLPKVITSESIKPPPALRAYGRRLDIEREEEDPLFRQGVTTIGPPVRVYVQSNAELAQFSGQITQAGFPTRELQWKQEGPLLYSTDLTPTAEGSFTVSFKGATVPNEPRSTSVVNFNFVCLRNPNTRPPLEGPPKVLTTTPADGSSGVDMTGDIRIDFSEPVHNLVAGQTVYLTSDGQNYGGAITSGGLAVGPATPNISSIIFKPSPALVGGKTYCLNVTGGVVDETNLSLDQGGGAFKACFSTFAGLLLTPDPVADPGDHLAVAGDYAATTYQELSGRFKFTVYDISEPHSPKPQGTLSFPQRAWGLAMAEDEEISVDGRVYSRIAVITTSNPSPALLSQHANLWVVDLSEPTRPELVGVTSLYLPLEEPALPYSVRIFGGRAYVGNFTARGVMAVELTECIRLFKDNRGRVPGAPLIAPANQAVAPMIGYGHRAKKQSVLFEDELTKPAAAVSVDVLSQTVIAPTFQGAGKVTGQVPVVYAADWVKKRLVAVGFPKAMDGINDFYGPDFNADDRIISFTPLSPEDSPRIVRTVAGAQVPREGGGTKTADLAVVFGFTRMWLFDVTMSPSEQHVQPVPYPSKSFQELDPELTGNARNCEVEGTLAYIAFDNRIAVIDFSDPANPRVIAKIDNLNLGASSVAVRGGFIYTLSPETGGLRVSIARPATQVFVHGLSLNAPDTGGGQTCANPVVIDRTTLKMRQQAEILFQVYGVDAARDPRVQIYKGGELVGTAQAALSPSSSNRVLSGRAVWVSDAPIDLNATYTVQVGANVGAGDEFHSQRAAIPFSFLIAEYQQSIGFEGAPSTYSYVLGANAHVHLKIGDNTFPIDPLKDERIFGLNTETLNQPGLSDGRYPFVLTAFSSDDGSVSDVVSGIVEVAHSPDVLRRPGNTVVSDVDLGTGSLGLSYTDLSIQNRGLSLTIQRSYNSAAANVFSPFGYGWHYNYQVLLTYQSDSRRYTVTGGDGAGQVFKEDSISNGEMQAEKPYHSKLVRNADGSFDYYTKAHVKYHFPGALGRDQYSYYNQAYIGNVEYIEDPNKNRLTFEYDELGLIRQITDPSQSRALKFKYEEAETPFVGLMAPSPTANNLRACVMGESFTVLRKGLAKARVGKAWRVKEIEAPGDLHVQYKYDADGNLVEVRRLGADAISVGAADYVWTYEYRPDNTGQTQVDVRHLLKTVVNPNGHRTGYEYELGTLGLPVKAVKYPGVSNHFDYELRVGRIVVANVTDGRSAGTRYEFDENGYNVATKGPRNANYTFAFNDEGLKTREADPEGTVTEYGYDSKGNETSRRVSGRGVNVTARATYDPTFSKPLSQTDFNGNTTTYTIDGAGNITTAALPTGRVLRMSYGGGGDLVTVVNERGLSTSITYDSYGNPLTVTRQVSPGETVTTQNSYDVRSRLLQVTDTVGPRTQHTYDTHERVVRVVAADPAGIRDELTTVYAYQPGGQVTSVSSTGAGQSLTTSYSYDGLGRVTSAAEEAGGAGSFTRAFTYDGNSNVTSVTDRRGVTTSYDYDGLNFLTKETIAGPYGSEVSTSYARDRVGNAVAVTDMYGQTTSFEFDGLRREVVRRLPGDYTELRQLDGNGNLLSFSDRKGRVTTFTYDAVNRLTLRRDPLGRTETWRYDDDPKNQVTYTRTPQGLKVVMQTDGLGRPLLRNESFAFNNYNTAYAYAGRSCNVSDPRGAVTHLELSAYGDVGRLEVQGAGFAEESHYAAFGAQRQYKDANGRETQFTVDSLNRRTAALYPGSFSESWVYDGGGNVLTHTDRRGVASAMTYDNISRPLTVKLGMTTVSTATYGDAALTETRLDAKSQPTVYHFDGLHRVISVTNPAGDEKSYEYDGLDLLRESDFKQQFTQYGYDAGSRPTTITDRAGQITNVSYSDAGGLTRTVTDRRGNARAEIYDPLGRLMRVSVGGLPFASYEYDGKSNQTAAVDGRGNRTAYTFDALSRVIVAQHTTLKTERFEYDPVGNLTSYDDGRGGTVVMTYDDLDHLKTRSDGAGNTTTFRYDGEGLLAEQTAPKGAGFKTSYEYNELRSLTRVTDAAGGVWEFGYDPNQNVTSVKDALGRSTAYSYDALDRRTLTAQPGGLNSSYGYDPNGNLVSALDPNGRRAGFGYDTLDRKTSANYPGASGYTQLAYDYGFDPEGNLVSVGETVGALGAQGSVRRTYARTYDSRNRVRAETDPYGRTVSYDYDSADNLTSVKDADGGETAYSYDSLNRRARATLPGGQVVGYDWTPDGLLRQVAYGSGMQRSYEYDAADRLTRVSNLLGSGHGEEYAYTYDANGNRITETRSADSAVVRELTYGYDALDRLTGVSSPARPGGVPTLALTYSYDAVGNRKSESGADYFGQPVARSYAYDELNRLTSASGYGDAPLEYRYDNDGNLVSASQAGQPYVTYEYDARSQLRRVVNGGGAEVARYDYDFERRRLGRSVGGGAEVRYVYGDGNVVGEYHADGHLLNRYDYGAEGIARGKLDGEGERWYFGDGLGSTTSLSAVDAQNVAAPVARFAYGAWGENIGSNGSANAVGYTGQRLDPETGFMPLGNGERYYSPVLGRFIQQDSWTGTPAKGQTLNRYAYVMGRPLTLRDPSGHFPAGTWWKAARAFVGGAVNGAANLVMEPFRQVVDVAVLAYGTQALGLDGSDIQMDSMLGKVQQRRVLEEGQGWLEAGLRGVRDFSFNFGTFGLYGYAGEQYQLYKSFRNGEIDDGEYFIEASRSGGNFLGGTLAAHYAAKASDAAGGAAAGRATPEMVSESRAATTGGRQSLAAGGEASGMARPGAADPSIGARVRAAVAESEFIRGKSNFREHLTRVQEAFAARNETGPAEAPAHIDTVPTDIYAFGKSGEPREPRPGIDVILDEEGSVLPQVPPLPRGASTFTDPLATDLTGHYHRLPAGTRLPEGMAVIADGVDVIPESQHGPGHYTLYPTEKMGFEEFKNKYNSLPWEHAGNKKKK